LSATNDRSNGFRLPRSSSLNGACEAANHLLWRPLWGDDTKVRQLSGSRSCGDARALSNSSWYTIFKVPRGGEGASAQKSSVSRSKSDNQSHAFSRAERRPDALRGVFSARIHAQRLKLSNLGSLEPDNSDTFVSSPLIGTAGLYCPRAYAAYPYSPACRAVWTVGRTASANSSADVSLSRLHCSAAPVIAQLTMVAFSSGDLAL
jgi:hypothetical protein